MKESPTGRQMSRGVVDVVQGVHGHSLALLGRQFTNLLRGTARPQSTRRHVCSFENDRSGGDECSRPDDGPAEHKAANADQGVVFNGAGVNNRLVAHGDTFADDARIALINMQDRTVLDVGILTHRNPFVVSAKNAAVPDGTAGGEFHAAVDNSPRSNVGGWVDDRLGS